MNPMYLWLEFHTNLTRSPPTVINKALSGERESHIRHTSLSCEAVVLNICFLTSCGLAWSTTSGPCSIKAPSHNGICSCFESGLKWGAHTHRRSLLRPGFKAMFSRFRDQWAIHTGHSGKCGTESRWPIFHYFRQTDGIWQTILVSRKILMERALRLLGPEPPKV